jgi:hypothetical protein
LTPPVIGRISIGRVGEKNGKRLPEKDDQFTITTQVQNRDGWLLHPYDEKFRQLNEGGKLRSIPVRLLFNDPDLNLRVQYTLFDREDGRPFCAGNGETCRRVVDNGIETMPCPSPDSCSFGGKLCKPYGRLNVLIGDDDALGTFIFRTTSFNSIRTLAARMHYFKAVSGGLLADLPLELRLRGKSTTQSHRSAIYYVDLVVQSGMSLEDAIAQAREAAARKKAAGFDQQALDESALQGFANGVFEESWEDAPAVADEFYPEPSANDPGGAGISNAASRSLTDKLNAKTAELAS